MDVREKLVELIKDGIRKGLRASGDDRLDYSFEDVADHLIANGVTVQEWISVKDRLPVIGRSVIAYNAPAKCAAEAMYEGEGRFLQFRWEARLQDQEVTHWMPLPQPPKGE